MKAHIIAAFNRRPVKGWTDFELEEHVVAKTGVTPQRVRTARAELTYRGGPIGPAWGQTRKTQRGYDAQVYVLR